ncbi:TPA: DUF4376 domain-containing protein [Salmonella enterica subsp. salamae serovar 28:r:e,n,z15]|nr:DUF4376 domain-containing protein [Salmonella enterica subsp. salamae serovar 28:r:e,n,z15]
MYHYSPSRNAFYHNEIKQVYIDAGSFPTDTVSVSDDVWLEFAGNPPPDGKTRVAGKDGLPAWVDIPPQPPEQARAQKLAEIDAWRGNQEAGNVIFTWKRRRWDASRASQERISPVLDVAATRGLPDGFFWTDADNNDVPVTISDLQAISDGMKQAMVAQGWKIHERQRQMKKEIGAMKNTTDILNYIPGWE